MNIDGQVDFIEMGKSAKDTKEFPSDLEGPTSRITCCGRCLHCCNKFGLVIMNVVDFLVAVLLLFIGIYLRKNLDDKYDPNTAWLIWSCLALGALLFLVSMLSTMSMCYKACRCIGSVSERLASLVAFLCLVMAIAFAVLRGNVLGYLSDHNDDIGLSEEDVDFISHWYTATNVALFLLAVMEFLRFYISKKYRVQSYRIQKENEYDALLDANNGKENDYDKRHEARKQEIREKYKGLREYYSAKNDARRQAAREGKTGSSNALAFFKSTSKGTDSSKNPFDEDGEDDDMIV